MADTPKGNIVGQRDDSPADIQDKQTGPARITPDRALHVNLRDNDGNELGSSGSPINTNVHDGAGTAITSTNENSDQALDVHVSNTSIEQTTGAAHSDESIAVAGKDGSGNVQPLATDTSGHVQADVLSSALPTGAATSANQTTANSTLSSIQTAVETLDNIVSGSEAQVDVVTSALPTGASTLAEQQTQTTALQIMDDWDDGNDRANVNTRESRTGSAPTSASVGTSSAQAVASNSNRKGLILTNVSANTISLGIGQTAVLNDGITLVPWGVWVMDEYTFTTAAINAIAAAASSDLAIQELT